MYISIDMYKSEIGRSYRGAQYHQTKLQHVGGTAPLSYIPYRGIAEFDNFGDDDDSGPETFKHQTRLSNNRNLPNPVMAVKCQFIPENEQWRVISTEWSPKNGHLEWKCARIYKFNGGLAISGRGSGHVTTAIGGVLEPTFRLGIFANAPANLAVHTALKIGNRVCSRRLFCIQALMTLLPNLYGKGAMSCFYLRGTGPCLMIQSVRRGYPLYHDFEDKLTKLVWRVQATFPSPPSEIPITEKEFTNLNNRPPAPAVGRKWFRWRSTREDRDIKKVSQKARPMRLIAPLYSGLSCAWSIYFVGGGISPLLQESLVDGSWIRFALLVTAPFNFYMSLVTLNERSQQFFSMQIINNLGMIIDPVAQYHENSRFYSAVRPEPNKEVDHALPHVTIEMPVYKESLEQTTAPSVFSLKKAMQSYARRGERLPHLSMMTPPTKPKKEAISKYLTRRYRSKKVLREWLATKFSRSNEGWKPWASNGRSIRIREIILLVDPDTIVTEDCLRDAVRELGESPEVAKIRHNSAHFTRRINKAISLGCANGEVAPFVGRNAFLRWSSLREAASTDPADGKKKIHMVQIECCSELIFNPLISWWRLAPVDKQLRVFVVGCTSSLQVHHDVFIDTLSMNMFSYCGLLTVKAPFIAARVPTIYSDGIAAPVTLSTANYFLLGFDIQVDGYYLYGFELFLAIVAGFPGLGNFRLLEYRLGHRSLFDSDVYAISSLFFSGLSVHLTVALLAHMFPYNITWGATKQEVEQSNFFIEALRILKRFWAAFFLCPYGFWVDRAWLRPGTGVLNSTFQIQRYAWQIGEEEGSGPIVQLWKKISAIE
ncbi:hypothetical protein EDD16DRAFT_1521953 [Pisolithus croceorrhizus]|nr:hypothetical protein EDD16DRAFT_1521953 [Pisolithus croceorrhizus]KAI6119284.1 hypothetical protein EV401DRAFT_1888274 [Pisolithus croceorrhizus]